MGELKSNLQYWRISLDQFEVLDVVLDRTYANYDEWIITDELAQGLDKLRSAIDRYYSETTGLLLTEIADLLLREDIFQYSELGAFVKACGISLDTLVHLKSLGKLSDSLKNILEEYREKRWVRYKKIGITNATAQVLRDFNASKGQGNTGIQKIRSLLKSLQCKCKFEYKELDSLDRILSPNGLSDLLRDTKKVWFYPFPNDPEKFRKFKEHLKLEYQFGRNYQDKIPDAIIIAGGKILIVEIKRVQNIGGHQNKQIAELIHFIAQEEATPNVCYVSFLDGMYVYYFKQVLKGERRQRKLTKQFENIEKQLKAHRRNYFVAPNGFTALICDLLINPDR